LGEGKYFFRGSKRKFLFWYPSLLKWEILYEVEFHKDRLFRFGIFEVISDSLDTILSGSQGTL